MPAFAAIRKGKHYRASAEVAPVASMTVHPKGSEAATVTVVASESIVLDLNDFDAVVPDAGQTFVTVPTPNESATVVVDATLTERAGGGADPGFPYTFPITFGGVVVVPETFTAMPASVEIVSTAPESVETGMLADLTILATLEQVSVSGFPYTFPITF
jgi:hypothetical protein